MLHLVLDNGTLKLFTNGVAPQEHIATCYEQLPAGHYLVMVIDGDTIMASPITAREVSHLAVRGRANGIRARWIGDRVLVNGVDAPLAASDVAFNFRDFAEWFTLDNPPEILSVGGFHVY